MRNKFSITPEQYQKILETTMPQEMQDALEEYEKDSYEEITDPQEIRKILGEWAKAESTTHHLKPKGF